MKQISLRHHWIMRLAVSFVAFCLFNLSGQSIVLAEGFKDITAPEVKNKLEKNEVIVINLMSSLEFEMQHISGSINIPFDGFKSSDKLPKDKNQPIVVHCMGKQ